MTLDELHKEWMSLIQKFVEKNITSCGFTITIDSDYTDDIIKKLKFTVEIPELGWPIDDEI